ncbi:MAG: Wzz/FepE/Etk N-terminal domain-containing protein [Planctomycetota bacterium]
MPNTNETDHNVGQILRHFRKHSLYWILPTLVCGALTSAYALVHQPQWVARQALTVRENYDENTPWSGQFNEAERQKHAQETFLELARSPAVVAGALEQVGPPASCQNPREWPTGEDVAAARERIEIVAPNGLEFGTTPMFYLNVGAPNRQRAIKLTTAIRDESETRFKQLRDQQTQAEIAELTNTVQLAAAALREETAKLQKIETRAGPDLSELRMLSDSFSGNSDLQTTLAEVRQELRQVENLSSANTQLLELLTAAQEDPAQLVATPNTLLESQPALRSLKEGLIEAQLNTSQLLGTMSDSHPRVKAAQVAQSEIRGHLHGELEVAVRGLRAEQSLHESQMKRLKKQVKRLQHRLRKLAGIRATYSNQLAEVQQQTDRLARARRDLSAARADLAARNVVGLVTRVDVPRTGPYPEGPGRSVIAASGGVGGFLLGLGMLVLTIPAPAVPAASSPLSPTASLQPTSSSPVEADPSAEASAEPGAERPAPSPAAQPAAAATASNAPATPRPTSVYSPPSASRHMTLKEALVRCNTGTQSWT